MAEAGSNVASTTTLDVSPIEVAQALLQSLPRGGRYSDQTQVFPIGSTTIRVTRRYLSQAKLVWGTIGTVVAVFGFVAFFFRNTEELTIDVRANGNDGSQVIVTGTANAATLTSVQDTLARLSGHSLVDSTNAAALPPTPQISDDGMWWWNGSEWEPA